MKDSAIRLGTSALLLTLFAPNALAHDTRTEEILVTATREAQQAATLPLSWSTVEQDAIETAVGLGYSHTRAIQLVKRVHLRVLPGLFLLPAAEPGTLLHGPGAAAVSDLASLVVLRGLLEASLDGVLVDLGAAKVAATTYDEYVGLFAAHEGVDDFVYESIIDEGLQAIRYLH